MCTRIRWYVCVLLFVKLELCLVVISEYDSSSLDDEMICKPFDLHTNMPYTTIS